MSDKPIPVATPDPKTDNEITPPRWGAPIISVYSLTLLLVALVFAYIMKNENLMVLLAGVVATNATTVVSFYVGSSASSAHKDRIISAQLLPPPTQSLLPPPASKP